MLAEAALKPVRRPAVGLGGPVNVESFLLLEDQNQHAETLAAAELGGLERGVTPTSSATHAGIKR